MAEPLRIISSELGLMIELLSPVEKPARTLKAIANKVTFITDHSIESSQFEERIVTDVDTILKPEQWK